MNGEELRTKTRGILNEILNDTKVVVNLERGIYNYTIWKSKERHQPCIWDNDLFATIYKNKLKQICANLIPGSYVHNPNLLERIKNNEFKPHEIVFASPCELFPERWEKIIQEKEKRDSMMNEIDNSIATNQFTCARCKGTKTTYYTMQTRSADEAETVFITCLDCGRRWRK